MKPELGKEVESDPELADFKWNGSDALLLMNQTIEHTNKARTFRFHQINIWWHVH